MNFRFSQQIKIFLKQTFLLGLVMSITVYAWLRMIFYELPFSFQEDSLIILKTILAGWTIMMVVNLAWLLLILVTQTIQSLIARN
jgi:hypothetical protein